MRRQIRVLAFFLLATTPLAAQDPFRSAPPDVEQALRARVAEFYTLFQQGKFREAEQVVAEESRDAFYAANKARIVGFEIRSVDFTTADLREATVLVSGQTINPNFGSSTVKMPLQSRWKRIEAEWYLWLDTTEPGENYNTPVGRMVFPEASGAGGAPSGAVRPPTVESLKTMYEVSGRSLRFPSDSEQPVTQTISVANRSQGRLTVERHTRDIPGLEVSLDQDRIPLGEELTISFTYVPEAAKLTGRYEIDFQVMPITQRFKVTLTFEDEPSDP